MALRIEWHPEAQQELIALLGYVYTSFGKAATQKVLDSIMQDVSLLADFPSMGEATFDNMVQEEIAFRSLVSKQHTIVYYVKSDIVRIVMLWNNRQDKSNMPDKLRNRN